MNDPSPNDQWNDCPPGELHAMVGRLRGRQRRLAISKAMSASAAVVLLVTAGVLLTSNPFGPEMPARIACHDVQAAMGDYIADRVAPDLRHRIDAHLVECETCHEYHRREKENAAGIETAARVAAITSSPTAVIAWLILANLSP